MRSQARAKQARRARDTAAAAAPPPIGQCGRCGRFSRERDKNGHCRDTNICEARAPALFRLP